MGRIGRQTVYINNDNAVILPGLRNSVSGDFIVNATVTCTLKDREGTNVAGAVDIAMAYTDPDNIDDDLLEELADDGNYIGILPSTLDLDPHTNYIAYISADGGSGMDGDWEVPVVARRRTQ